MKEQASEGQKENDVLAVLFGHLLAVAASKTWRRPRVLRFLEKNHDTCEEQRSVCAVVVPGDGTVTLFGDRAWREQLGVLEF